MFSATELCELVGLSMFISIPIALHHPDHNHESPSHCCVPNLDKDDQEEVLVQVQVWRSCWKLVRESRAAKRGDEITLFFALCVDFRRSHYGIVYALLYVCGLIRDHTMLCVC